MADEKRSGSFREFMRDYSAYIILAIGLLFFVAKEKIAGNLPAVQNAIAGQQTIIEKQQASISELKIFDAVRASEIKTLTEMVGKIDGKLDRLLMRRRAEDEDRNPR